MVERSEALRSWLLLWLAEDEADGKFEFPALFRVPELPGRRLRPFLVAGGELEGEPIELRLETECLGWCLRVLEGSLRDMSLLTAWELSVPGGGGSGMV